MTDIQSSDRYTRFADFYPYYLSEHQNTTCKRLHFIGSACILILIAVAIYRQQMLLLWAIPLVGYGFAWVGHFFFEKNKPATFKYPVYSLMGDWLMFWDILRGKIRF